MINLHKSYVAELGLELANLGYAVRHAIDMHVQPVKIINLNLMSSVIRRSENEINEIKGQNISRRNNTRGPLDKLTHLSAITTAEMQHFSNPVIATNERIII